MIIPVMAKNKSIYLMTIKLKKIKLFNLIIKQTINLSLNNTNSCIYLFYINRKSFIFFYIVCSITLISKSFYFIYFISFHSYFDFKYNKFTFSLINVSLPKKC